MFVICVLLWVYLVYDVYFLNNISSNLCSSVSCRSTVWQTQTITKMLPIDTVTWRYRAWAQQYMFTVWVCGLVLCVCGNYCDLNAGSAGETGCLLINERSRWPRVGGSSENTASRSGGQHNTDTWAITNKTSQAADTRHRYCVYIDFS